jgi:hypothetical protein
MATKPQTQLQAYEAADPAKRYFTVDEANRALPYVRRVITDVREVYQQIVSLRRNLEQQHGRSADPLEREYEQAMDRLSYLVDEVHAVGAELKDFERGLVDFPAQHEGRDILLCWHAGEDRVDHWHELENGYAGRRSVALL